jgi:hypothetical protein
MVTRIVKDSIRKFTTPGNQTSDLSDRRATANIRYLSPTQQANLNAAREKLRSEGDYKGARLIGRDAKGTGTMRFVGHDLEGNDIIEGPELPDGPPPLPSGRTKDHFQRMAKDKEQALAQAASDAAKEAADAAKVKKDTSNMDRMDQRPISPLPVDPRQLQPQRIPSWAKDSIPTNSMLPTNESSNPTPLKRGGKVKSTSNRGDGIAQRGKTKGKFI